MGLWGTYGALALAIACEVAGTSFLNQTQQFTRLLPTMAMALCYGVSLFLLSIVLKEMPVGIAYAIWSGLGIVLISLIGWIFFRQSLDLPALIGIGFILVGVVIVNGFSRSVGH